MNREIKFRVWLPDGLGNRMLYDPVFSRNTASEIFNNYWMMFVGLKDSTGKEIYEGDILIDRNGEIQQVTLLRENDYIGYSLAFEEGRVVGNIYETPSLMEKL